MKTKIHHQTWVHPRFAAMASILFIVSLVSAAEDPAGNPPGIEIQSDPIAKGLLDAVSTKLAAMKSLRVDAEFRGNTDTISPNSPFAKELEIALMRESFIRIDSLNGLLTKTRAVSFISNGKSTWLPNRTDFIMEKRPVRTESFHFGHGAVVQYFFSPNIVFNPLDALWKVPASIFDTNKDAYNRSVRINYLGEKNHLGERVKLVEMHFNTQQTEIREVYYINAVNLISQIDTHFPGWYGRRIIFSQLYRNYRIDEPMDRGDFEYTETTKMPVREVDPVRLGEVAPDFELPLNTGGTAKLSELLKGKKALLIVTLDGAAGNSCKGPDYYLAQMRVMQQIRDKFQNQGLEVVALVGGDRIVPEVKDQMLRAWLPDQTRFSYPIAIDLDVERGIQGSAYHNFQFRGRNNVLLDDGGRMVFACTDFTGLDGDRRNEQALYQALSHLGFVVSPADLEPVQFDERLYSRPGS